MARPPAERDDEGAGEACGGSGFLEGTFAAVGEGRRVCHPRPGGEAGRVAGGDDPEEGLPGSRGVGEEGDGGAAAAAVLP